MFTTVIMPDLNYHADSVMSVAFSYSEAYWELHWTVTMEVFAKTVNDCQALIADVQAGSEHASDIETNRHTRVVLKSILLNSGLWSDLPKKRWPH